MISGRHPLQELVIDTFVSNDAYLAGQDFTPVDSDQYEDSNDVSSIRKEINSVVVCTGANACGKVRSSRATSKAAHPLTLIIECIFEAGTTLHSNPIQFDGNCFRWLLFNLWLRYVAYPSRPS